MTRAELLTAFGYELNKQSTMDATTQARALTYINQAQRAILSTPGLQHLRQFTTSFATVASQAFYGLAGVARVDRIWDPVFRRYLLPLSISQYAPRAFNSNGPAWSMALASRIMPRP